MIRNPLIHRLRALAGLKLEDAKALLELCQDPVSIRKGKRVLHARQAGGTTNYVVRGWAARCALLADGSCQITAILLPGDFCDLHSETVGGLDHDVFALTPLSRAAISTDQLGKLESCRPGVARALWWAALVEQEIQRAWITNIALRDGEQRLAHLICELHERLHAIGLVVDDDFQLPLTQAELGEALGLSAVHTNRVLQRMRHDGTIRLAGGVLSIVEPARLRAIAGFDPGYLHGPAEATHPGSEPTRSSARC